MKRILITSVIFFFIMATTYAQNPLPVGKAQLNLGVGFSNSGIPIYGGFDIGVAKNITLGGELSYRSYNENWHSDNYHHNVLGISANGNYHFNTLLKIQEKWDVYAGLNLGFYSWSSPSEYDGNHNSGVGLGAQVGARYFFSKKVGINLEFGGGNEFSGGKFGLTIRL
jgi:outer membrane immunogenic protein